MMKTNILIIAFTLAGLVGMAQTNQPLPSGAVPFGATTYLSPLDSTIWLYKERGGTAVNLGSWHKVDSLFGLGYTKGQIDSVLRATSIDGFRHKLVSAATTENARNDQSSIISLVDGTIVIAYSRYGPGSLDVDESSIYYQTSRDDGESWSEPSQLIEKISLGSYIPSLYKKENGNILCVFFVRESTTPTFTSSIRRVEFSPDLSSIVSPVSTILSPSDYFPIAPDRILNENGRLVIPYPRLVSGTGTSYVSVCDGNMLISDDEGDTWTDLTLGLTGKIDERGFGGVLEPGVFLRNDTLVYYFRTTSGSIYAYDLTRSGGTYSYGSIYNLGIRALNAQSAVKHIPAMNTYVASYTRFQDPPTSTANRQFIDLSVSSDANEWSTTFTVANAKDLGEGFVNEPTIFVNEEKRYILVSYSYAPESGKYDLRVKRYPFSSLSGSQNERSWFVNPAAGEFSMNGNNVHIISQGIGNRYGNITRNRVDVVNDLSQPNGSYYSNISHGRIRGRKQGGLAAVEFGNIAGFSPQTLIDSVWMKEYNELSIQSRGLSNVLNGAKIDTLTSINIEEIVGPTTPVGAIGKSYAIRQRGNNDINYFAGKVGVKTNDPQNELSVAGTSRTHRLIISENAGPLNTAGMMALKSNNSLLSFHDETGDRIAAINASSDSNRQVRFINDKSDGYYIFYNSGTSNELARIMPDHIRSAQYRLSALNAAPASATSTGTTGEIRVTATHIYVCIATDTWVRSELTTW